jgi:hypothetical protein
MKFTLRNALLALFSASTVLSLPLETRQQGGVTDLDVLQFALTVWFTLFPLTRVRIGVDG